LIIVGDADAISRVGAFIALVSTATTVFVLIAQTLVHGATPARGVADDDPEPLLKAFASAVDVALRARRQQQLGGDLLAVRWRGTDDEPAILPGDIAEIVDVYRSRTPNRLVILGAPGSGKSVYAMQLALDLLGSSGPAQLNGPLTVPVVLRASSWNPFRHTFDDWAARQIEEDYPMMAKTTSGGPLVEILLRSGRIVPILDGLDELLRPMLAQALVDLDSTLAGSRRSIVVTSRTQDYPAAIAQGGRRIRDAVTIELEPLTATEVIDYLAPTTDDREWWHPAITELSAAPDGALAMQLQRPLAAWLVRRVYPRGSADTPARLVEAVRHGNAATVMLDRLVPTMLHRSGLRGSSRWMPFGERSARRCLGFVANTMRRNGRLEFGWWELRAVVPRWRLSLPVGVCAGTLMWLGLLIDPRATEVAIGAAYGAIFGFAFLNAYRLQWSVNGRQQHHVGMRDGFRELPSLWAATERLLAAIVIVVVGWAVVAALAGVTGAGRPDLRNTPALWIAIGTAGALALLAGASVGAIAAALLQRLQPLNESVATIRATTPAQTLSRDRRSTVTVGLMFFVILAIVCLGSALVQTADARWVTVAGIGGGAVGAMFATVMFFAWPVYLVRHTWLALTTGVPWRFATFLGQAHDRGLLHQAGPRYQFRHAELLDHLTGAPTGHRP